MKFLIIGLGSMGKRRIRNLLKNGETDIIGYDPREDRTIESSTLYKIPTFNKFEEALNQRPDVFIISCPPDKHLDYAYYAIEKNIHFFSEVNTESPEKLFSLFLKLKEKDIVAVPSCTMRFHPCVKVIKETIQNEILGKPLLLTFHSGEYLEDWHPWEKVTDYYVGKKESGGGRDQIMFELEWIRWIMGDIKTVSALTVKLSQMKADIYDVYDLMVQFSNNSVGNVLVDVIQHPPNRILHIVCEQGVIHWDWMTHKVKIFNANNNTTKEIPEREGYKGYVVEEMYEEELKQFLNAVLRKESYPITFKDEYELLKIMYASEQSSHNKQTVDL